MEGNWWRGCASGSRNQKRRWRMEDRRWRGKILSIFHPPSSVLVLFLSDLAAHVLFSQLDVMRHQPAHVLEFLFLDRADDLAGYAHDHHAIGNNESGRDDRAGGDE